jgi:Tfp pilus assembly protein PilF
MTLSTGTLLSQRYEIRAFVGSDGTLEVYKGLDLRLGRDVAVTVLEIRSINDPDKLLTFEKEAQIRASLHHPRIMTIHDFGHDASCAFQVAEWLDGQSLRKKLKSGLIEWVEAARIGRAVIEGLALIHAKGFTLHVLDSASVFLQRDGTVKLFAYELKLIEGSGYAAANRDGMRSLAKLLIRCTVGENPVPSVIEQSRELSALRDLAEGNDLDTVQLRSKLEAILREKQAVPAKGAPGRWITAATLLLCIPGLAVLYSRKTKAPKSPSTETIAAPGPAEEPKPAQDSDAQRLYLYGMQLLDNRDPESLRRAQTYLQGAVTREPNYALAHCGLADCYGYMGLMGLLPKAEAMQSSQASIQRALGIDPKTGEAHSAMAFLDCWYKLDLKDAEKEYLLALDLGPKSASIHDGYGVFLANTGRLELGLGHIAKALELQPLSRPFRTNYAVFLHWAGRSKESMEEFAKVLEQDPSRSDTLIHYRDVLEQQSRLEEAIAVSAKLAELNAIPDRDASALKTAFDAHGVKGYWNERVRQMEQSPAPEPVHLAELVLQQGDKDRALRLLARALREGSLLAAKIPQDPAFEPLRQDPRFRQLVKQVRPQES